MSRVHLDEPSENFKAELLARGRPGRELARPLGCNYSPSCYVEVGAAALLTRATEKAPRCAACGCKLKDYCRLPKDARFAGDL